MMSSQQMEALNAVGRKYRAYKDERRARLKAHRENVDSELTAELEAVADSIRDAKQTGLSLRRIGIVALGTSDYRTMKKMERGPRDGTHADDSE